ncbi:TadE/TadG family type IV pilus assembly protein [Ruegeria marina]|uniref:Flp pilus assembly protein TadG n=1 Tax=Ruegeria marina TaxID=639004 RepID=A0A1G6XBD5_9RHOB|nr:hypothetical protein [Ruegeria marina]SDD75412.1 hypothetical protein SAMN04488239_11032 [Ruegeria marina]
MFTDRIKKRLKRFRSNEEGSIAVEALLTIPILFWTLMIGYTYFDGYREAASNVKAAYTIGDLISRETRTIDDAYINSMVDLYARMVGSPNNLQVRISLLRYEARQNRHRVRWSANRGFPTSLTNTNVDAISASLPPMSDLDTLILVETKNTYQAPFSVGLDDTVMESFIFTRPRFTNEIAGSV